MSNFLWMFCPVGKEILPVWRLVVCFKDQVLRDSSHVNITSIYWNKNSKLFAVVFGNFGDE